MRRFIESENPKLGSLEPLDLSFSRLRTMFSNIDGGSLPWAAAPLAAVNKIRNKFAHRLDAVVEFDDLRPVLEFLRPMVGSADNVTALEKDPATAIDVFALLFGLLVSALEMAKKKVVEHQKKVDELNAESRRILSEFLGTTASEDEVGV